MIAAVGEGFPYTSIKIRGHVLPLMVGCLGSFMAIFGIYLGFSLGTTKRDRLRLREPNKASVAEPDDAK
jgi:hypothetical protein